MVSPDYLYDFTSKSTKDWSVVNDGVMGGLSEGYYTVNEDGNGVFKGEVSLENNGGFTSIRKTVDFTDAQAYKKIVLRLKGDGKRYQFRLKRDLYDRHSYIQYFETSGEWEEIELRLKDFYPSWRGRTLDMPNFEANTIKELRFLIANKKPQEFELEIDYIALK
jgi:hypothetical protein